VVDYVKLPNSGTRLDRIDNNKTYLKDNVVPCCKRCNVAKNNMTQTEFISLCIKIVKHKKTREMLSVIKLS
jgi:hypothetical protein